MSSTSGATPFDLRMDRDIIVEKCSSVIRWQGLSGISGCDLWDYATFLAGLGVFDPLDNVSYNFTV